MIYADQIPPEVVEAAASAAMDDAGWHWDTADEAHRNIWRRTARASIAAALNAWPWFEIEVVGETDEFIILPLPQENSDDA